MKFKMNNSDWEIKEISNAEMNDMFGENGYTDGVTNYTHHIIYINNDILDKKRTLYHELMHCFLYEYGHNQNADKSFSYDDVCEVSACSHDIIHSIVEEYFSPIVNIAKPFILTPEMIEEQQKFGKDEGWKEMKL